MILCKRKAVRNYFSFLTAPFSFSPLFFFSEKNIHVIMKYKIHFGGYSLVSDTLPNFYDKGYQEYTLTVKESDLLGNNKGKYYLKHRGIILLQ